MKIRKEDEVWCLVMFDLPVETKKQRREANQFRHALLDAGFSMIQFSVYGKYSPTVQSNMQAENFIKSMLPSGGEVRIFHLRDSQWARATRYISRKEVEPEETPQQLVLF